MRILLGGATLVLPVAFSTAAHAQVVAGTFAEAGDVVNVGAGDASLTINPDGTYSVTTPAGMTLNLTETTPGQFTLTDAAGNSIAVTVTETANGLTLSAVAPDGTLTIAFAVNDETATVQSTMTFTPADPAAPTVTVTVDAAVVAEGQLSITATTTVNGVVTSTVHDVVNVDATVAAPPISLPPLEPFPVETPVEDPPPADDPAVDPADPSDPSDPGDPGDDGSDSGGDSGDSGDGGGE